MVASLTPLPLLQRLRSYVKHANLRVRAKAAVSISNCVSKMVKIITLSLIMPLLVNSRLTRIFRLFSGARRNERVWAG